MYVQENAKIKKKRTKNFSALWNILKVFWHCIKVRFLKEYLSYISHNPWFVHVESRRNHPKMRTCRRIRVDPMDNVCARKRQNKKKKGRKISQRCEIFETIWHCIKVCRRIRVHPTLLHCMSNKTAFALIYTPYTKKRQYSPKNSLASNNISNYLALVKKSP